jgi:hypothetical protein
MFLQAQVLEADDPRVVWAAQNQAALQQREQAEAARKVELLSAAKEYLDKVYKVRAVFWFVFWQLHCCSMVLSVVDIRCVSACSCLIAERVYAAMARCTGYVSSSGTTQQQVEH